MRGSKIYIGTQVVKAIPMKQEEIIGAAGYRVSYPDGALLWWPKDTFEATFRELTLDEGNLIVKG